MTDHHGVPDGADNPTPTILTSRLAHDGFVRLRIDEVRLPTGTVTNREFVEHPGAVAILALTDDDHVVLVRQWRHAAGRFLLEVPAGTREPGESVETTARRELLEETGHKAGVVTELRTFFSSPGYSNERITLVRADGCRPVAHRPDPDEGASLVRLPVSALPVLLERSPPAIEDGKTIVALLSLRRDRR